MKVRFLVGMEPEFVAAICMSLLPMVFTPDDMIYGNEELFVIYRGIALYGGKVITSGSVWGEVRAQLEPICPSCCPSVEPNAPHGRSSASLHATVLDGVAQSLCCRTCFSSVRAFAPEHLRRCVI